MGISAMAALLGALMLMQDVAPAPAPTPVQEGRAVHGPLYPVPGETMPFWMTAPEHLPDGRFRVWHWMILSRPNNPAGVDVNGYAILTEYDCPAGTSARIRREWWLDDRFIQGFDDNRPHRVRPNGLTEAYILTAVCKELTLPGRVEDTAEARRVEP